MLIQDKLKELRKEKDISQEAIAKHLSISRSTYAKWENGIRVPQKHYLEQIANYYEINICDILGAEDTTNLIIHTTNKLNKTILGVILGFLSFLVIAISILYFFKIYGTYCIDPIGIIQGNTYVYITYSLLDMENNFYPIISLVINLLSVILSIILFFSYEKKYYHLIKFTFVGIFTITIIFMVISFLSGRFMLKEWLGDYFYVEV